MYDILNQNYSLGLVFASNFRPVRHFMQRIKCDGNATYKTSPNITVLNDLFISLTHEQSKYSSGKKYDK